MGLFLKSRKNYLGIDIGTNSIKILEVEKVDNTLRLVNYGEVKGAGGSEIFQTRESLFNTSSDILKKLFLEVLSRGGFNARRASISIPVYSTFSFLIEVPLLERKDLEEAIKYEAQKHIPMILSEMILEWKITDEFIDKQNNLKKLRVFIMAIPRDIVTKYEELAENINLDLDSLEVEIFSLKRAAGIFKDKFILVDIGGLNTNITFFDGDIIRKTVNLPFAGSDFTRLIQTGLKVEREEAERLKIEKGLLDPRIKNVFYSLLNNISIKIQEFLTFDSSIEKIILAGGSTVMPGFLDFVKEKVTTKTIELINPWKMINYDQRLEKILQKKSGAFGVVCGLALKINEIEV